MGILLFTTQLHLQLDLPRYTILISIHWKYYNFLVSFDTHHFLMQSRIESNVDTNRSRDIVSESIDISDHSINKMSCGLLNKLHFTIEANTLDKCLL